MTTNPTASATRAGRPRVMRQSPHIDRRPPDATADDAESRARAIAQTVLAGFDRHYALFRYNAQQAKARWERGDWHGIRRLARERIEFYDQRVCEAVSRLESGFSQSELDEGIWSQVKRHFVAALADHRQPELAETFFNSVSTKILHRSYFHNDFLFVRPAVATAHLDGEQPSWRAYFPHEVGLAAALRAMVIDLGLACPFVDAERDVALLAESLREELGDRSDPELLAELREVAGSLIEDDGDSVVVRHLYIERRMVPLNIYLERASAAERERAVIEYGNAIREMVAANIFPGDMLYKNFGVTRQGRVVFYDYDEVAYLTDCNFREIPAPRTHEEEMAAEPWYAVAESDVFPEEFATFLLGNPSIRSTFMAHHAELLGAEFWRVRQQRVRAGLLDDVFPYPESLRFARRFESPITPKEPSA